MGSLYIGGRRHSGKSGWKWKLGLFLILFSVVAVSALKVSAPFIVEQWINKKGATTSGYAFSVRDVVLGLEKGQLTLNDVKVYNPETHSRLLESPKLVINFDWRNMLVADEKKLMVQTDKVDLFLSKDFASEMERIKDAADEIEDDLYLQILEGRIGKLTVVEKMEEQGRTVLVFTDVGMKVKDVSLHGVNKKTEFSMASKIAKGGELNLAGKIIPEGENTAWKIEGAMKQVPADIFNRIAGDKLPFSFLDESLNAQVTAHSKNGAIMGEIKPDIQRLNLLKERPEGPTQSITRALTEELTFSLPFSVTDKVSLQYEDTFKRLVTYRRYPAAQTERAAPNETPASQTTSRKKSSSWTF